MPATYLLLWRTAFGLRLRSCGENPAAADSLGVPVYRMKYIAVVISGALAGLGGVLLVFVANIYREGQTNGRGFIGLAALDLRQLAARRADGRRVPVRLRRRACSCAAGSAVGGAAADRRADPRRGRDLPVPAAPVGRRASLAVVFAVLALVGYLTIDELPAGIVSFTPHLVTLLVLSLASQRLRPPQADGLVYRRGEN